MNKYLINTKKWLNPTTTSFVYASIEEGFGYPYGELKIADCNRIVTLDLAMSTGKERKATLKKLDLLLGTIQQLRDKIEEVNSG